MATKPSIYLFLTFLSAIAFPPSRGAILRQPLPNVAASANLNDCEGLLVPPALPSIADVRKMSRGIELRLTEKFRKLPKIKQASYLGQVSTAIAKLPSEMVTAITAAHYNKVFLVIGSLKGTKIPELVRLQKLDGPQGSGACSYGQPTRFLYFTLDHMVYDFQSQGSHVMIHEFCHAFDRSLSILRAGNEIGDPIRDPDNFSATDPNFMLVHKADSKHVKNTWFEDIREHFAEGCANYLSSEESRAFLKKNEPNTFRYFENWFGDK